MSQIDAVTVTVGEHSYECFKLDPWILNDVTHRIVKTLGPALGDLAMAALTSATGDGAKKLPTDAAGLSGMLEKDLDLSSLVSGFGQALKNLDASETQWLLKQLAAQTTVVGGGKLSDTFAQHFLGRPGDMYRWGFAALRSQYDFFE